MDINFFEVIDFFILLALVLYYNHKSKQRFVRFLSRVIKLEIELEELRSTINNLNTAAPQPVTTSSSIKPNVLSRSAKRRIARRKARQALKKSATLNDGSINISGD